MRKIIVGLLAVSILTVGLVGLIFAHKGGGGHHAGFGGQGFPPVFGRKNFKRTRFE